MKILYFARLRQIIGRGQDDINVPAEVKTVSALIDYLKGRDEGIAAAFADLRTLKVAVNQSMPRRSLVRRSGFLPTCHGRLRHVCMIGLYFSSPLGEEPHAVLGR